MNMFDDMLRAALLAYCPSLSEEIEPPNIGYWIEKLQNASDEYERALFDFWRGINELTNKKWRRAETYFENSSSAFCRIGKVMPEALIVDGLASLAAMEENKRFKSHKILKECQKMKPKDLLMKCWDLLECSSDNEEYSDLLYFSDGFIISIERASFMLTKT